MDDQIKNLQKRIDQLEQSNRAPIRLVYAPKKLNDFRGIDQDFDEWSAQAKDALKIQSLTGQAAAEFIIGHLVGQAWVEVNSATEDEKRDPVKIMELLKCTFGEKRTAEELLDAFRNRKQRDKETIIDFSIALINLISRAKEKDNDCISDNDKEKELKRRFATNLKDPLVRRDTLKANREHPNWSFRELRAETMVLAREIGESRGACGRTVRQEAVSGAQDIAVSDDFGSYEQSQQISSTCNKEESNEVGELKQYVSKLLEMQRQQQQQLEKQQDLMVQMQKQLKVQAQDDVENTSGEKQQNRKSIGPCYFCKMMGHLQRNCLKYKRYQNQQRMSNKNQNGITMQGQPYCTMMTPGQVPSYRPNQMAMSSSYGVAVWPGYMNTGVMDAGSIPMPAPTGEVAGSVQSDATNNALPQSTNFPPPPQ